MSDKTTPPVIADPPMCFAPSRWVCDPNSATVSCKCELLIVQYPGRQCTASIAYGEFTPYAPRLVPMEAHCDIDGAALALAVILSRLLTP